MAEIVILSPHFDDAVLNCWHALIGGDCRVMTVFGGRPPAGTTRFWDRICGEADSHKMVPARRRENEIALSMSGSKQPQVYLDFLDNQYRSRPVPVSKLVTEILAKAPAKATFLAPLAASWIYKHPDHILVRQAGVELYKAGHSVKFYPDSPYMTLPRRPQTHYLRAIETKAERVLGTPVSVRVHRLGRPARLQKIEAMRAYRTQYKMTNLNSLGGLARIGRRGYEVTVEPAKY